VKISRNFLLLLLFSGVITLGILRILLLHRLEDRGREYHELTQEIKTIRVQNSLLRQRLLEQTSLQYVASRASSMGFIEWDGRVLLLTE
jgi:hypothetical protein